MSVVYAEQPLDVPTEMSWPDWLSDRPAPGAHIEPGAPVCTVMAQAEDVDWQHSYYPIVGPDYAHAIGETFLMTPATDSRAVPAVGRPCVIETETPRLRPDV